MATMQRGCSAKKPRTFSRESVLRKPTPPSARAPCAWKDRFARSRPMMLTLSMDALSVRGMRKHHHLGTSRCRQEEHPLHHLLSLTAVVEVARSRSLAVLVSLTRDVESLPPSVPNDHARPPALVLRPSIMVFPTAHPAVVPIDVA